MPVINSGSKPVAQPRFAAFGGIVTAWSGGDQELSRTEIPNEANTDLAYKKVVTLDGYYSFTVVGGTATIGAAGPDLTTEMGKNLSTSKVVSVLPAGESNQHPIVTINLEPF